MLEVDAPYYSLNRYDNFTTVAEEELSVPCIDAYTVEWRAAKVDSMVVTLNGQLASGELCPSQISVALSAMTFAAQGHQVNTCSGQMSDMHAVL